MPIGGGIASKQKAEAAKGEANSKVVAAEGEAKSNQIRQRSITPEILKFKELEIRLKEIEKWNGQKPGVTIQAPNVQVPNPSSVQTSPQVQNSPPPQESDPQ